MGRDPLTNLGSSLFREAGDALFLFDPDSDEVLDVNPMSETLSGFSRKELLAKPAAYWFRFGGQGGKQRLREAASKSGVFHAQDGFFLRTHKDGVWIAVNVTVTRLHVEPKTLALITARDMREQRAAEAALRESEQRLQAILDNSPAVIYMKDVQGHYQRSSTSPGGMCRARPISTCFPKTSPRSSAPMTVASCKRMPRSNGRRSRRTMTDRTLICR
jgi:PAS domain S-box-containing protein